MFDYNYFKSDIVILFLLVLTVFSMGIIFYRKRHGIKFRSLTSISMVLFYFFIVIIGIYTTYYEVLSDYYFRKNLYKEATYRFIKADELKKTVLFSILDKALIYNDTNREKNKMLSFYISKNYYKAIPYLKKAYENENNIKISIFLKLFLAHAYFETGNQEGKTLLLSSYLEAVCFLSIEELKFYEDIIHLNSNLDDFLNNKLLDNNF